MTTTHWEFIAECLRQELADYGGLLHLFEVQQRSLFERNPDAVLQQSLAIEQQARSVADCRGRRLPCGHFAEAGVKPVDQNSSSQALARDL